MVFRDMLIVSCIFNWNLVDKKKIIVTIWSTKSENLVMSMWWIVFDHESTHNSKTSQCTKNNLQLFNLKTMKIIIAFPYGKKWSYLHPKGVNIYQIFIRMMKTISHKVIILCQCTNVDVDPLLECSSA
jgi:hypothetical protein